MVENSGISFFELEVFLELADRRTQRSVSRSLGLTPSHVSKILRRLEVKLDRELIKSSQSGIILTREGLVFVDYAKKLLKTMAEYQSQRSFTGRIIQQRPVMTIATVSFLGRQILAPELGSLQDLAKNHRYRIVEMSPDSIVEASLKGAFEIAVNVGHLAWTRSWQTKKVGVLKWGLFARKGHSLIKAQGQSVSINETLQFPFVVPTYWQNKEYAIGNDLYPISWQKRIKGHEASSAEMGLNLITHSDNLAFVPKVVATNLLEQQDIVEIDIAEQAEITRPIYLSVNIDKVKKSTQEGLVNIVKQSLIQKNKVGRLH